MSIFIENVNNYMSYNRIKQTYISLKTGIEPSKLSRLLKGVQDVTSGDMEKISTALGKQMDFFVSEDFEKELMARKFETEVAFYAGEPGKAQCDFAMKVIDLIENADEILGIEDRILMMCKDEM